MKTRLSALVAALALIGAACATESVPASSDPTTPALSPATEGPSSSSTTTAATGETTTSAPNPDVVAAPDFTLALGDGGSFTLSEEARPVFLVFWAEW